MKDRKTAPDMSLTGFEKTISKEGLPASLEAEKGLLGAVLLNNELLPAVLDKVHVEDLVSPAHKRIFTAVRDLYLGGTAVDLVSLKDRIEKSREGILGIGGFETLPNLLEGMPFLTNVDHYVAIIKEKSLLRKLIRKSLEIIDSVYQPDEGGADPMAILTSAEKAILEVGEESVTSSLASLGSFSTQMMTTIDSLVKKGEHVTGVSSKFPKLDEMTSGFQKKDLILLAARPSIGKTAFALSLALNAARSGRPVAFFSLEMSKEQLFFRLISQEAHVDLRKVRTGYLSKENIARITRTIDTLSSYPIFIDDNPAVTVLDIGAKLRRLKSSQKVDMVILDYLQLMSGRGLEGSGKSRFENRNQEVAAISRALKMLAKEVDLPIIALSQLSRAPEKRGEGNEPVLSDLRDSGSLEQDADLVLFLHRPFMFAKNKKELPLDEKTKAKLIIAKQRNGPTGEIDLTFLESFTQFTPYAPIEE